MYSVQEGASRERYRPSGARPRCSRTGRSQDAFTSAAPIRSLRHLQPIARPASTESTFSSFPPTSLQIAPWPDAGASYVLYRPRACSATRTGRLTAPTPRDTRRFFVLRFPSAPLRVVIARSVSDLTHGAQQQNAIGASRTSLKFSVSSASHSGTTVPKGARLAVPSTVSSINCLPLSMEAWALSNPRRVSLPRTRCCVLDQLILCTT